MSNKMTTRKRTYISNKEASVGKMITCPICGTVFKKIQYSQAFCNRKCKDTYWNAKGDRHEPGYYEDYDNRHPKRMKRRALYGSIGGELTPRQHNKTFSKLLQKKIELEIFDLD